VYPGDSLVKELEMLTEYVGLTPGQALTAATVGPARWFGRDTVVGTIEVGKAADMVLLGSNPLIRSRNLRDVLGVMLRGTYYSRAELRRRGTADN
jgi:imidazolonepropionase-like amidohydrolase